MKQKEAYSCLVQISRLIHNTSRLYIVDEAGYREKTVYSSRLIKIISRLIRGISRLALRTSRLYAVFLKQNQFCFQAQVSLFWWDKNWIKFLFNESLFLRIKGSTIHLVKEIIS